MSESGARDSLPVVAIGASAGGLEACRSLLNDMPGNAPAAFVLVLHLDPTHDSMMVDLLARHTGLKVVQASEGMALGPGALHVIPQGVFLTVARRILHLSEPEGGRAVRLPFDVLLRSLAEDAAELSTCIVLSGTGTDGSMGLADIHAAGGMVIAQDPSEAGHPGMPESAIRTGLVDRIVPAGRMAAALADAWGAGSSSAAPPRDGTAMRGDTVPARDLSAISGYEELLAIVGENSAQDVSLYKRGTLERRIARRMALVGLGPGEVTRYVEILLADAKERANLAADMLTRERHRTTANDLENVLYSTDVATLSLDADLNIRFFTPAARAIFHVIPTDVGRPLADLAAVSKDDDLAADARAVLASSDPIEREISGPADVWFLRRVQPYRAERGRVEGVVVTYVDITERKRTNAALVAALGEADRATKAKSRFLASASHDLRQPMQSMALLHRLLSRQKRSTEAARLLALLDQTLTSMTAMLDSMLDVNRIESGIVRPQMRPAPIAPLLQRLADEFAPQCALKGLKLKSVPCKAWVRTDPLLLEQMLRNLLSNALKYTQRGGTVMGCRRRGRHLTTLVRDSGIGVPEAEAEAEAIFEAYHQVEKAAPLSGQGLGLGLSIVQRLAQLMDHPVSVHSTPGKGSAFMITLPIAAAEPETTASRSAAAVTGAPQTGTILLVEDDEPLRDLLEEVLVTEGHRVKSKADAQDALAWASGDAARPDLLLTDLDLHGSISGLRLA